MLGCSLAVLWLATTPARAVLAGFAESPLLVIDTGARPPGRSAAVTADLVINTRGSGAVGFFNSAYLTLDTRDGSSLSVPVKTVDGLGANLAGVTVTARQNGLTVASATTGGNGAATLAGLLAGYYELRAEKAGYLTQVRSHQRVPEDVSPALTFRLTTPPVTPVLANSALSPVASLLAGFNHDFNQTAQLKLFQGGANGTFAIFTPPDPNKMTIVLTHGCDASADRDANSWPLLMARKLAAVPGRAARANIVAWDWRAAAAAPAPEVWELAGLLCAFPRQNTPDQGLALGQALRSSLGANYAKPVHFLGHSLGTLVNCAAVNYLHGDDPKNLVQPGWDWRRTQVTLFDEAELLPDLRLDWRVIEWASPIPKNFAYLDNYMTIVGFYHARGLNVFLQETALSHEFPYEWYQRSIENPGGSRLGFRYSFELLGEAAIFPIGRQYEDGALFAQDGLDPDPLALVQIRKPEGLLDNALLKLGEVELGAAYVVGNLGLAAYQHGVQALETVVDFLGNAAAAAGRKFGNVLASVRETIFGNSSPPVNLPNGPIYLGEATTPAVLGIPGYAGGTLSQPSWGLKVDLQTQPPPPPVGPQSRGARTADPAPTNTPAYVWLPVQVPSNAVALVFDFTLSGDGASDRVVAGINASNLFSLAMQFIATNTAMSSGPLPVERWAGQDVELFLGVAGGTSTNALLSVSGIRFLSLPLPLLVARNSGPNAVVSWTEASPGFVLEYTTNLTAAAGSWSAITNVAGYVGQRVFTNQTAPSGGFYRLRRP